MRTITRRLIRQNRYEEAQSILEVVADAWRPDVRSGLQALATHAGTSLSGRAPENLRDDAAGALQGADRAWEQGDVALAADLIVIGAGLLLHRDLHADVEKSPLADDPQWFLTPLRRSTAMQALRAPVREVPTTDFGGSIPSSIHVVVLPGTYPRFAAPLIDVLRHQPGVSVDVVDLPTVSRSLRWLGTDPDLIRLRLLHSLSDGPDVGTGLRRALGQPREDGTDPHLDAFGVPHHVRDLLARADVVVADWGDRGAMWASLVVPASTRLVLRLHGMDSLSLWVHALDWSRVDALVTVSPHHADLTDEILRHSAAAPQEQLPRCQVVPHVVRLRAPLAPAGKVEREPHTLGMIGWSTPVKDPLWAVEVLAALLRRGGHWRLRLIGAPLQARGVVTSQTYARRLEERIRQPDVDGAVVLVPQTDDIAAEVERLGFIVSASRRESFHLGLVEGVLGGAVPVVRDWPFYARYGGPARLFPADWIVSDVDAAVERVWALRLEQDRDQASERAGREVAASLDPELIEARMIRAVLGQGGDESLYC